MKYLVLGSEGQIGKSLVEYLKAVGETVFEYDLKFGQDLRNPFYEELSFLMSESDFVFFLAWDVGGSKYLEEKENTFKFLNNNIAIMHHTFSYLERHKKPFLFTSSQMSDMAHSIYGNTKMIGEKYTKILNGLCVKLWNVYGEHDEEGDRAHVITDFIQDAKIKNLIQARTSGEEKRQFLYVKDCCEAFYILSKKYNEIPKSKSLHITSFEWITISKLAEEIATQLRVPWMLGQKKDRVQNDHSLEPDKFILNFWKPSTSLKDGIASIISHKANKNNV